MYVAVADRRQGVASAMLSRLMDDARGVFRTIRLRTDAPEAAAFYDASGFGRVDGDAQCTHRQAVSQDREYVLTATS
jgi:GNAT superfamily N-acetyltransferase